VRGLAASSLQHTATPYNILQHPATSCNTQQHTCLATPSKHSKQLLAAFIKIHNRISINIATPCNTLQHPATPCNTLQHPATYRNTLQHTGMAIPSKCSMQLLAAFIKMHTRIFTNTTTPCNTLQHPATHLYGDTIKMLHATARRID